MKQTAQGKLPGQLSEDYLQAVIDSLEDELIVIDLDYRIVQANRAVLRRHGKSIEEIIGRHCYEISHSSLSMCCPPHDDCPVARACESGKAARTTHRHVYNNGGRQKQRYVEVVASPILNKEGTVVYVVEVLRDVTEAREMELKIAEAHRDLLTLNDITNVVSQSLDMETVLSNALDRTLKVLKAEGGGILLHEVDAKSLRYRVHRGLSEKFVCEVTENQDAGITAQVMRSLKPVFINDVRGVHGIPGSDALRAEGLRSFASLPLVLKGKLLGALNIAGRETRRFSDQEKQLLENIAMQVSMAIENARLHEEVQKRDLERGELLRQMYSIQEEERKRIARELHDETTQSLVGMAASLEAISSTLPKAQEPIKRKLKTLQSVSLGVLDEMHRMIYELRPSMLDDFGLVPAVRLLAQKELNPAGIVFDFKVEGREKRIPPRLESTLFRVIQEAMNNIVRHSRAKKSRIILRFQKNKVNVLIADDGTGFDTNEAISPQTRPKGLGLLGMRERVGLVNGVIRIQSESGGGGTEITIEVPLLEAKD